MTQLMDKVSLLTFSLTVLWGCSVAFLQLESWQWSIYSVCSTCIILCSCDVLALFTVTIIVHALYMKQLHCDAPFRTVVWHDWTVSTDPTIDIQLCSCTVDNMKGFVQCTIQNIFIPFSNGYTRVAIHSCMEVPFLHYMACGSSWELCGGTIRWYKLGVLTDVVSCQVIQSGYPGAYRCLQSCVGTRAS